MSICPVWTYRGRNHLLKLPSAQVNTGDPFIMLVGNKKDLVNYCEVQQSRAEQVLYPSFSCKLTFKKVGAD